MKLVVQLKTSIMLIHKSGNRFDIDKVIEQECEEGSEMFKSLVETYKSNIKCTREENKQEFDKELGKLILRDMKAAQKSVIEDIENVIKQCYSENKKGYISYAGTVINVTDFSAISIEKFDSKITKC